VIVSDEVGEEAILIAYAESEMFSGRWAEGVGGHLTQAVAARVRYSPVPEWSDEDRRAVLGAIRELRPPLLEPLLHLEVRWFASSTAPTELPTLGIPALRELQNLAPDGRLGTLVASLEKGRDTPDAEFSGAFRRIRASFDPAKAHGRPCLVAESRDGPYTVFEGMTRLAATLSAVKSGRRVSDPVPTFLGVTARLDEWGFAQPSGDPTPERPAPD